MGEQRGQRAAAAVAKPAGHLTTCASYWPLLSWFSSLYLMRRSEGLQQVPNLAAWLCSRYRLFLGFDGSPRSNLHRERIVLVPSSHQIKNSEKWQRIAVLSHVQLRFHRRLIRRHKGDSFSVQKLFCFPHIVKTTSRRLFVVKATWLCSSLPSVCVFCVSVCVFYLI